MLGQELELLEAVGVATKVLLCLLEDARSGSDEASKLIDINL